MSRVVGFCRFSLIAQSDYKQSHADEAARAAYLYDEARLAARFACFETLTLPSLDVQTRSDFTFYVLTSPEMPAPWRARLEALLAPRPYARLVVTPTRDLTRLIPALIAPHRPANGQPVFQFRLDDDDAVAASYIDRVHGALRHLPRGAILSFPCGYFLYDQDGASHLGQVYSNLIAIGLGRHDSERPVFSMAHFSIGRRFPVLSWPTPPMFIHNYHGHNDTIARKPQVIARQRFTAPPERMDALCDDTRRSFARQFPGIDPDALHALHRRITAQP